ncbi:MAG: phage major capsid protein [Oscillospiraceae bacterium]|jgi:hypothetical protein|nr:phage major capsid protein [Oscillospiraceae bacterium]
MAFDTVKLDKGFYAAGQGFSQVLEEADPSGQYRGTALGELDAYERQLKRFGIRAGGPGSDRVEKFFQCAESAVLFPEYVARAVRQGMERADVLPGLAAAVTLTDRPDYRSISCTPGAWDPTDEGEELPVTLVRTKGSLVAMKKRGQVLNASYEAARFQRLDLFTVTLRQIGAGIARAQLRDAVDVLLHGDGDSGAAESVAKDGAALRYTDVVKLWSSFGEYEMTTLLAAPGMAEELLALPEFRDAYVSGGRRLVTPLGAELIRCSAVPAGKILALDKNCALEMVKAGEVMTDADRLIDRQLERAAISATAGFAKLFAGATKVLG